MLVCEWWDTYAGNISQTTRGTFLIPTVTHTNTHTHTHTLTNTHTHSQTHTHTHTHTPKHSRELTQTDTPYILYRPHRLLFETLHILTNIPTFYLNINYGNDRRIWLFWPHMGSNWPSYRVFGPFIQFGEGVEGSKIQFRAPRKNSKVFTLNSSSGNYIDDRRNKKWVSNSHLIFEVKKSFQNEKNQQTSETNTIYQSSNQLPWE